MPIDHKFKNHDWKNGFFTKNAILHTPFKPEVIFIGTFNHGWDWNNADFFYGRDMYMWSILGNLFLHNKIILNKPRNDLNKSPSLDEIFKICLRGKIAFADIISGTKEEIKTIQNGHSITVNNNFEWNKYSDKQLNTMGNNNWLISNSAEIIKYINDNKTIKNVYFTFKSETWLIKIKNEIISETSIDDIGSIFTPTGMGFRKNLTSYEGRSSSLAHCWVWNGLPHKNPINKLGYVNLNHNWLKRSGINVDNF